MTTYEDKGPKAPTAEKTEKTEKNSGDTPTRVMKERVELTSADRQPADIAP
jgi:hypothetical protein